MKLTGCKKGIEIGTFTGFSALSKQLNNNLAQALLMDCPKMGN